MLFLHLISSMTLLWIRLVAILGLLVAANVARGHQAALNMDYVGVSNAHEHIATDLRNDSTLKTLNLSDLQMRDDNGFTTLSHPRFPSHSMRIKRTLDFCDPTVKSVNSVDLLTLQC